MGRNREAVVPGPSALEAHGISRRDVVRLLTQSLLELGYERAAVALQADSGVELESAAVLAFRRGVVDGEWGKVLSLIPELQSEEGEAEVRFLINEQRYLELLEAGNTRDALNCLRSDLTPSKRGSARLHHLSSLMVCQNATDLRRRAGWDGAGIVSRTKLLAALQAHIPAHVLLPSHRLEALITQAIDYQKANCLYHNMSEESYSLFTDHMCSRNQVPRETKQILSHHTDEVWVVQFSKSGKKLASGSKDCTVIVWDTESSTGRMLHRLVGHTQAISFVTWSPDESMLLSCSNDYSVRLWDVMTGQCKRVYNKHTEAVTACAWFPDSSRFVSGSVDGNIFMWDLEGGELRNWSGVRINDLAVTPDGQLMVGICGAKKIHLYYLATGIEETLQESDNTTSMFLSDSGRFLLVNTSANNGEIHNWDLREKRLVQKYRGQKQGRFVIRSAFGGTDMSFVISGSEDSQVYLWHRHKGKLLEVLAGHTGTVNSVTWNPVDPYMFASASDDHTIRLWGCR